MSMTPEEKRIAIAKACGWRFDPKDSDWCMRPGVTDAWVHRSHIPNYLGSLDAMHEAEKVLTKDQWATYAVQLGTMKEHFLVRYMSEIGATAPQRAEAFLHTLNLWEE